MYKKLRIYFLGIGGIGMSGIAEVLLNLGYPVSGSDIKRSAIIDRLRRRGAHIHIGHREKNVQDVDVMVMSSAIRPNNPELVAARRQGIRVIQRAEMLSEIMRLAKYGIAVAGSHGKTWTTSLLATVLGAAKIDPTVIIGGRVRSLRSNARLGKGDFMVAEADESDGSFLKLFPSIAVVTNIDPEHLQHYGSFQKYREAFYQFCNHVPFYGLVILCGEHPQTVALSRRLKKRYQLYGFSPSHDLNAQNIQYRGMACQFDLYQKGCFVDRIQLNSPGRHSVLNSLAVIAVAREIGISMTTVKKALRQFKGVARRMEILIKHRKITAIDDYAHHPAEIQATLKAIRQAFSGRLVVLFQPHRYSRTRMLFKELAGSFGLADKLFVTGIYPAGEVPVNGVSGKKLAAAIARQHGQGVQYLQHSKTLVARILGELKSGDVFLSLGAGDVTTTARQVASELKKRFK